MIGFGSQDFNTSALIGFGFQDFNNAKCFDWLWVSGFQQSALMGFGFQDFRKVLLLFKLNIIHLCVCIHDQN